MLLSRLWRRRLSAGTSRCNTTYLVKQSGIASHQESGWYACLSQCDRQSLRQVDSSADGVAGCTRLGGDGWKTNRSSHSTSSARAHSSLKSPLEILRERSAEMSAVRELFTVSGGGGAVSAVASGMRYECFAYRRNNDETPSVNPVKCASTPPLFDSCMRSLVLACGVMTMSRQAGLGLADLLVNTSTTSPCCNS